MGLDVGQSDAPLVLTPRTVSGQGAGPIHSSSSSSSSSRPPPGVPGHQRSCRSSWLLAVVRALGGGRDGAVVTAGRPAGEGVGGAGPGEGLGLRPRAGLEGGEGPGGGGGREEPGVDPVLRSVARSIVGTGRAGGGNKTIGNRSWAYTIFQLNSYKNQQYLVQIE